MEMRLPGLVLGFVYTSFASAVAAPVKLIIDTDIGGGGCADVDDAVAICMAHSLQTRGEAELLAIVQDTAPSECAGAISVFNHFYGRDNLPIGAYNISTSGATLNVEPPLPYVTQLVQEFESRIKNSSQADDAVAVYRRVLSAQPDRSVTISSIGIHTNLAALLQSGPDEHSALDGHNLVAQKVVLLAVIGGGFPASVTTIGHSECNLCGGSSDTHNTRTASAASAFVATNWPRESKIVWSGFEVGLQVQSGGAGFQRCAVAAESPLRTAMTNYMNGPYKSRFSWDPLTTLVAVRGAVASGCDECADCDGVNSVDAETGNNVWIKGAKSNQTYLVLRDADFAGRAIDQLLCLQPEVVI